MGKNRILKTPTYLSVFVCCFISGAFAQAATFTVNSPFDAADANPGDAMCETAPGNGVCTLRAAIEEANTLGAGDDTIIFVKGDGSGNLSRQFHDRHCPSLLTPMSDRHERYGIRGMHA